METKLDLTKPIQTRDGRAVELKITDGRYYSGYPTDTDLINVPAPTSPEPPEGHMWHNPAGLTPEQVGVPEYRLLLECEVRNDHRSPWCEGWGNRVHEWRHINCFGVDTTWVYRVKATEPFRFPKKLVRVPLGPEDVPPGSVFRRKTWGVQAYITPSVWAGSISYYSPAGGEALKYAALMDHWQILRPGQTEWQPCYKEVEQ